MKSAKNLLILFLALLAVKDLLLGSFLLFNLDWILSHAGMTYSNDVKIMASFFGVCVLIVATLCLTAISWVSGSKPNAIFLSKFIGWWMVIASIIVYFKIGSIQWSAVDFISGILILIPAYIYQAKANHAAEPAVSVR
jgi:hypothetical protein